MPFPRGVLADPQMVRIETPAGVEIPSGATELARWRHLTDPAADETSIRALLLSFNHECVAGQAASYQVRWGAMRSSSGFPAVSSENVANGWGPKAAPLATEPPATDNFEIDGTQLREPKVWVTLPPAWLMKQEIRGPAAPISDAALSDYMTGFAATVVNDVALDVAGYEVSDNGSGLIDWRVEIEGWLYDRPNTLFNVYVQTGDVKWLRHAHRASQYYASWISTTDGPLTRKRGSFMKKALDAAGDPRYSLPGNPGDPRYSLPGGILTDYLLTGDATLLDRISAIGEFLEANIQTRLKPLGSDEVWDERNVWTALEGALYAFEATGQQRFRARAIEIVDGIITDIATPPPGYPVNMRGVLLHTYLVHEEVNQDGWIVSPWMSALLTEALDHYYRLSGDRRVLTVIHSYAKFIAESGLAPSTMNGGAVTGLSPMYIAATDSTLSMIGSSDHNHAYDVLGLLYRGVWSGQQLTLPTAAIQDALVGVRAIAMASFNAAHRATAALPRYRTAPTRKFAWWFGTTASMDWLISETQR